MHPGVTRSATYTLVAHAQAGDTAAWETLCALYAADIQRTLGQRPTARAHAAALAAAYAALPEYVPRREAFQTWLTRTLTTHRRAVALLPRLTRTLQQALHSESFLASIVAIALALILLNYAAHANSAAAARLVLPTSPPVTRATYAAPPTATRTPVPPTPIPSPTPTPDARITFLLLGLDARPGTGNAARTDTLMLASWNPETGDASLLSIPRDLYVDIPGYGPNRINTAYFLGEYHALPGGGPALTMQTLDSALGLHVDHWVAIQFSAFEDAVDLLGGVSINVPYALYDPAFPARYGDGVEVFALNAGPQWLDGTTTLKYVRTRHVDNDFGRGQRQRQVLLAIQARLSDPQTLANMLARLPAFLTTQGDAVRTDLTPSQITELAWQARTLTSADIRQVAIGPDATTGFVTTAGAQVLLPIPARVHALIAEFLAHPCPACASSTTTSAVLPPVPTQSPPMLPDDRAALATEGARIAILNGTHTAGLAARLAARLTAAGLTVVEATDAPDTNVPATMLYIYVAMPASVRTLNTHISIPFARQVFVGAGPGRPPGVDVQIVLGPDYRP